MDECADSGNPLVLKNAMKILSLDEFDNILEKRLFYLNDDRQFDLKNMIDYRKWFTIVFDKSKPNVYTHSKTRQPLHNDNSWFSDAAEMVFLAFEKQAEFGGETTIYQLDRLLSDLYEYDKNLLELLQNVELIIKKDSTGKYYNKTTVIKKEESIHWNYYRIVKSDNQIKNMCNRFFKFLQKKEKTDSVEIFRCESSDILCFNDLKLLHGRLAFSAYNLGDRILHQSMWHRHKNKFTYNV